MKGEAQKHRFLIKSEWFIDGFGKRYKDLHVKLYSLLLTFLRSCTTLTGRANKFPAAHRPDSREKKFLLQHSGLIRSMRTCERQIICILFIHSISLITDAIAIIICVSLAETISLWCSPEISTDIGPVENVLCLC